MTGAGRARLDPPGWAWRSVGAGSCGLEGGGEVAGTAPHRPMPRGEVNDLEVLELFATLANMAWPARASVTTMACSGHTVHDVGEPPNNARTVHGRGG